ncbi:MAG: hypothetical protein QOD02_5493 [Mycobacterium sp.]|nr:hypothetical protein [Mycobacterium sp.]MDT5253466.1 hypothetical protein [Mycobacterium sp.]MDT5277735.1 hypothetical protein [Mycobacterium sp.]MDT5344229.1 hypothetical protein [Mycobacterium sp.]
MATVRRSEWGVIHDRSAASAARSDRRMFVSDVQPPSRLANTGPSMPDSATNAVSASTPKRGSNTVCGGASPLRVSCRCSGLPAMRPWSISVPAIVTVGGSANRSTSDHRSAKTSFGRAPVREQLDESSQQTAGSRAGRLPAGVGLHRGAHALKLRRRGRPRRLAFCLDRAGLPNRIHSENVIPHTSPYMPDRIMRSRLACVGDPICCR